MILFLNSALKDFNLKIIGNGPDFNKVSKNNNIPRIEFLGSKTNSEVLDLIQKSYAVVTLTKL